MGHKGDMEARYTTNKAHLPPDMIEDMRQRYQACEPFPSTTIQPLEQASIVKQAKIEALKSIASSLLGLDLLDVKVAKEREKHQALTADEEIQLFENAIKKYREPEDDPQIIVHEAS
jgi:lactate dehydrogenase-like 2-hydroxyacid dehydrogenase